MDSKVDSLKAELKQDIELSRQENMTAHANNGVKQDEMNTKLNQLLSIMSQLAVPNETKANNDKKSRRNGKEQ